MYIIFLFILFMKQFYQTIIYSVLTIYVFYHFLVCYVPVLSLYVFLIKISTASWSYNGFSHSCYFTYQIMFLAAISATQVVLKDALPPHPIKNICQQILMGFFFKGREGEGRSLYYILKFIFLLNFSFFYNLPFLVRHPLLFPPRLISVWMHACSFT